MVEPEMVEPEPEPTVEPEPEAEPEPEPEPAAEPEPLPPKPTCEEITSKSRCKVTQGCAWREKGAKGECIPHGEF